MLFGLALAAGSIAVAVADLVVRNARVYTVTALTRQGLSGGDPFVPEQAIDLATAIRAYTPAAHMPTSASITAAPWPPARPPT